LDSDKSDAESPVGTSPDKLDSENLMCLPVDGENALKAAELADNKADKGKKKKGSINKAKNINKAGEKGGVETGDKNKSGLQQTGSKNSIVSTSETLHSSDTIVSLNTSEECFGVKKEGKSSYLERLSLPAGRSAPEKFTKTFRLFENTEELFRTVMSMDSFSQFSRDKKKHGGAGGSEVRENEGGDNITIRPYYNSRRIIQRGRY
jgi:hypothetical protein